MQRQVVYESVVILLLPMLYSCFVIGLIFKLTYARSPLCACLQRTYHRSAQIFRSLLQERFSSEVRFSIASRLVTEVQIFSRPQVICASIRGASLEFGISRQRVHCLRHNGICP